jgi:hypothetical protein
MGMHTDAPDTWYIRDVKRRMQKRYSSRAQAHKDFQEWSAEEPGRYELLRFHQGSMTFLGEMTG